MKARALVALVAVLVLSACSGDVTQRTAPTVPALTRGPVAASTSGDPYLDLARTLHDRGVVVWFEADLVKRWLEGPAALDKAVARLGVLAHEVPVAGFKIADELGYDDGITSVAQATAFLRRLPGCPAPRRPRRAGPRRRARAPARVPRRRLPGRCRPGLSGRHGRRGHVVPEGGSPRPRRPQHRDCWIAASVRCRQTSSTPGPR